MESRATNDWFNNVVLYQRYTYVVLWNLFIQALLIWAIKLICLLLSPSFGFVSAPITTVLYCQVYLAVLVCCLCYLFFKNAKEYPELPGAPISVLYSLIKPHNWVHGSLFAILGALWSQCLLAMSIFPSYSHFWPLTPACLQDSSSCCVSEHHFFLFVHGAYLGISFYFVFQIQHLYCLKFESVQQLKLPTAKTSIRKQIKNSFFLVLKNVRYFYLFYCLFGFIPKYLVFHLFGLQFCGDNSLTSLSGLFDIKLFVATCTVGTYIYTSWTIALSLVQIFLTESFNFPVEVSLEKDKAKLLTNAFSPQSCDLLQHLAFQHLAYISQYSSKSRQKIFAVSIPGGHPRVWNEISERCLQVIDTFQTSLYEAVCSPTTSTAAKPVAQLNVSSFLDQTPQSKTSFVAKFPQTSTPLSPSSKFPSTAAGAPSVRASLKARNMVNKASKPCYSAEPSIPSAKNDKAFMIKGLITDPVNKALENVLNKPVVKFLTVEPSERKLEKLMCSCQLVIWSVNALTFLVTASYTEDQNGVVQWSISKIISSLLELQMAVERCPKGMLRNSNSKETLFASPKNFSLKSSLSAAINSGLYHITCTFKQHLKYIQMSDEHWKRIDRYLQMKE